MGRNLTNNEFGCSGSIVEGERGFLVPFEVSWTVVLLLYLLGTSGAIGGGG